jgi:hypothetical protein
VGFSRKASHLFACEPDIAVIPECSNAASEALSYGYSGLWTGSNLQKGLAAFCRNYWTAAASEESFGRWLMPIRVEGAVGFNLLAV